MKEDQYGDIPMKYAIKAKHNEAIELLVPTLCYINNQTTASKTVTYKKNQKPYLYPTKNPDENCTIQ